MECKDYGKITTALNTGNCTSQKVLKLSVWCNHQLEYVRSYEHINQLLWKFIYLNINLIRLPTYVNKERENKQYLLWVCSLERPTSTSETPQESGELKFPKHIFPNLFIFGRWILWQLSVLLLQFYVQSYLQGDCSIDNGKKQKTQKVTDLILNCLRGLLVSVFGGRI